MVQIPPKDSEGLCQTQNSNTQLEMLVLPQSKIPLHFNLVKSTFIHIFFQLIYQGNQEKD